MGTVREIEVDVVTLRRVLDGANAFHESGAGYERGWDRHGLDRLATASYHLRALLDADQSEELAIKILERMVAVGGGPRHDAAQVRLAIDLLKGEATNEQGEAALRAPAACYKCGIRKPKPGAQLCTSCSGERDHEDHEDETRRWAAEAVRVPE